VAVHELKPRRDMGSVMGRPIAIRPQISDD
jgi:hypothetical protein